MSNLSASDVAICLKVCKSLRSTIGKCLASKTKLSHQINVAATKCAFAKEKVHLIEEIHFENKHEKAPRGSFFGIDDAWFYRDVHSQSIEVMTQCRKQIDCVRETRPDADTTVWPIPAFPTQNPQLYFVYSLTSFLMEVGSSSAKIASIFKSSSRPDSGDDKQEMLSENADQSQPFCIRYKIFQQKKDDNYVLSMSLLGNHGEISKSITIDRSNRSYSIRRVYHLASNEEVKNSTDLFFQHLQIKCTFYFFSRQMFWSS